MPWILLLEDDARLGEQLSASLRLSGYDVDWCRDLKSARAKVKDRKHDLAILDWSLPDGTGHDFARRPRLDDEEAPLSIPMLFLTARDDEESALQAFAVGAGDYIRKTVGQAELLVRIRRILGE